MYIDRVHFYVDNAAKWRDWFVRIFGFQSIAGGSNRHTQTEVVSNSIKATDSTVSPINFVLSSPLNNSSPVAHFLNFHPPGVADLAFAVTDLQGVMEKAIASGAKVLQPIQKREFPSGSLQWSQILSPTSLKHSLVQRRGIAPLLPEDWILKQELKELINLPETKFTGIDHLVLNVAAGNLEPTVNWYQRVLGFQRKETFKIETERSGLYSEVMVHPVSGVQFPVNEPLSANSQIQEFIEINRGSGIQHLALKTEAITETTEQLRERGLSFLTVPREYYHSIKSSYPPNILSSQEWQAIMKQEILVDYQQGQQDIEATNPLLLQIFSQPIFSQPTFFFELIQRRRQARGFGEGNFRALFEAIEREQLKRS